MGSGGPKCPLRYTLGGKNGNIFKKVGKRG